jgi:Protein of unknown function (DUF2628)
VGPNTSLNHRTRYGGPVSSNVRPPETRLWRFAAIRIGAKLAHPTHHSITPQAREVRHDPFSMTSNAVFFIHDTNGAAKVKLGFSWPAFFFGALWAAVKRMWVPHFLVLSVLDITLWLLTGFAEANGSGGLALLGLVSTIGYAVVRGKFGNRWLTSSLLRKGFKPTQKSSAGA